jgi:anaerobic magnesium-protoporphyrin IX monomethyl ester cyclase
LSERSPKGVARVVLIKPPLVVPVDQVASQSGIPPIGVAYLAAALHRAGHRVQAIDGHGEALDSVHRMRDLPSLLVNGLTADQVVDRVDPRADLIAVSCMFSNEWVYAKRIIRALGQAFPGVPIVAGGEHVTAEPERSLRELPELTAVGLGEGEETLVALVEALTAPLTSARSRPGRGLDDVAGLAFLRDGQLVKTATRSRIQAVDSLAPPLWDVLPVSAYHDAGLALGEYNRRAMPILATRGCPYRCTFCSNEAMWEPRWYSRDPQAVVAEIAGYVQRYGIDHVDFCDLTLVVSQKWTIDFCRAFIDAGLTVSMALPVGTRSESLTAEVLSWMKKAGVTRVQYAPESGSPATLKRIKKRVDLDALVASVQACVELEMTTKATLIYGFPGQTRGEVLESIRFMLKLARLGVHDVACFRFAPYPGSELYEQLKSTGLIDVEGMSEAEYDLFLAGNLYNKVGGMRSYSEHIPHWAMPALTLGGMATFYGVQFGLRPRRLARVTRNLLKGEPLSMFETTVHGLLRNFATGRRVGAIPLEPPPRAARSRHAARSPTWNPAVAQPHAAPAGPRVPVVPVLQTQARGRAVAPPETP